MRNAGGYATIISPTESVANFDKFRCETLSAGLYETDTATCCHCNRVVHIKAMRPMDEFGSFCRSCMKYTCPTCADGPCVPFMKKLDEAEKRAYIRSTYE